MCNSLESWKHRESENRPLKKNKFTGWKASTFDADAMRLYMEGGCAEGSSAEKKVENVMRKVRSACDAAMPRRGNGNPHKLVYWWNDRIAHLRAKCYKARKLSHRAWRKPTFPELEEKFKLERSKLTRAIKHSKRQSRQQPTCPKQLEKIISTLFPKQDLFSDQVKQETEHTPLSTREELLRENKRIENSKVLGMDNIPNVA